MGGTFPMACEWWDRKEGRLKCVLGVQAGTVALARVWLTCPVTHQMRSVVFYYTWGERETPCCRMRSSDF